jgi:glyoxylase-like metal-dependent hydrolase (beta-lactamase superfamily II)
MIRIHEIDLLHMGVPGAISAWLVQSDTGNVLIESGPASTLPALRSGLQQHGTDIDALDALLLTHIHLDHAGAAWTMAQHNVPVYVHTNGARHLLDPVKLNKSSRRIFGERFETLWGALEPCPPGSVHAVKHNEIVCAADMRFNAIETLGHANHHHAWHLLDNDASHCFVGDAAAMRLPGTSWITIPMPPPEFDVDAWLATIDTLEQGPWTTMHLTHCGVVLDTPAHLHQLRESLYAQVAWIRQSRSLEGAARREAYCGMLKQTSEGFHVPEGLFQAHVSRGLLDMNLSGVDRAFPA